MRFNEYIFSFKPLLTYVLLPLIFTPVTQNSIEIEMISTINRETYAYTAQMARLRGLSTKLKWKYGISNIYIRIFKVCCGKKLII